MRLLRSLLLLTVVAVPTFVHADPALDAAVAGAWRTAEDKSRDAFRHPVAALGFWGLKPGMTILEVSPGGGWWTEILAPYARATGGTFYVTGPDLANPNLPEAARQRQQQFDARFAAKPEIYGKVNVVGWSVGNKPLPAATFDFILTARAVHGWTRAGTTAQAFTDFFLALKPGGVLALEQHRAATDAAPDPAKYTGYVSQSWVIAQAEQAGFKLAGTSEINANPRDTKDHPFGVWTLPPTRTSAPQGSNQAPDPNFDHSKFDAIGESDRMTLRFVKPL